MNRIDCSHVRREIEEAANDEILAAPARDHLKNCAACSNFGKEQQQLKEMVGSLGGVEAPADFDFKLRARLAASHSSGSGVSGNGFGLRSIAFATLLLLFGFAVVVMNMRSRTTESGPVAQAPAPETRNPSGAQISKNGPAEEKPSAPSDVAATVPVKDAVPTGVQEGSRAATPGKRGGSSAPQFIARNGRVKATDLSATAAPVFRSETAMGSAVFPLGTPYQSLKVSVDDGRGSSRTISLPTVSFGSSRVLARNPAPTMISTRDSW